MENFRHALDTGSKKFVCPNCNKRRFVRYRDNETGNYLTDDYGRCDRETNCGYHKAPPKGKKCYRIDFLAIKAITDKAYKLTDCNGIIEIVPKSQVFELAENQCWITEWYLRQSKICYLGNDTKYYNDGKAVIVNTAKTITEPVIKPSYHDLQLQHDMIVAYNNQPYDDNLTSYLHKVFSWHEVQNATCDYYVTGTNHYWNNATVFWQIDEKERIHGGKIMLYSPDTGKRIKEPYNHINWVHNAIEAPGFNLNQCLFGLHLINEDYQKTVGIVESEKTAIIMSMVSPDLIWLATGSKMNLKSELMKPLRKRNVVLFPDKGEFRDWKEKSDNMEGDNIAVSELLEGSDILQGSDLADYYLETV